MNTVTIGLEEYLQLRELYENVLNKSKIVSYYYSGHSHRPEDINFYTENEAVNKLIGDNAVLKHKNEELLKEIDMLKQKR